MDKETQKTLIQLKLDKLEELDKHNQIAHKRFKTAIIKLLDAKTSNSGLKYLDPEFYLDQAASTMTTIENGHIFAHNNKEEKFCISKNSEHLEVLDKPFKYIDTYTKDVTLMNRLQSMFKEVFDGYIEYANYLNSIRDKKHK